MEPKALAAHWHSHSLNLSVKTTTEHSKLLKDVICAVGEICILVKFSPKKNVCWKKFNVISVLKTMMIKEHMLY